MAWLRVTQNGNLTLFNADRLIQATTYTGVDPTVQTLLTLDTYQGSPATPQQAIDQTLTQLSTALTAVSVGGA